MLEEFRGNLGVQRVQALPPPNIPIRGSHSCLSGVPEFDSDLSGLHSQPPLAVLSPLQSAAEPDFSQFALQLQETRVSLKTAVKLPMIFTYT